MRKPGAVIFDMDGVLVDTEPFHCEIEKILFGRLGIIVDEAVHLNYMGVSNEFMYTDLKSRFNLQASVEELIRIDEAFRCHYFKNLEVIPLKEGVITLLGEIKSEGLKLAVATSSSPAIAKIILSRCDIASWFDAIVTTHEAGNSKPAPDVYLLAAERLGVASSECIVFEDSPNGLLAAQSAGMVCVAIQSDVSIRNKLSKADHLIRTFTEITPGRLIELFAVNHAAE